MSYRIVQSPGGRLIVVACPEGLIRETYPTREAAQEDADFANRMNQKAEVLA